MMLKIIRGCENAKAHLALAISYLAMANREDRLRHLRVDSGLQPLDPTPHWPFAEDFLLYWSDRSCGNCPEAACDAGTRGCFRWCAGRPAALRAGGNSVADA
jgi:hypothetical protein